MEVNERAGYDFWKESVRAWFLCAKREPLRSKIGKDVALIIAKLIPVDLSGIVKWRYNDGNVVFATLGEHRVLNLCYWCEKTERNIFLHYAACFSCLRFSSTSSCICKSQENSLSKSDCKNCRGYDGICWECLAKICNSRNILVK